MNIIRNKQFFTQFYTHICLCMLVIAVVGCANTSIESAPINSASVAISTETFNLKAGNDRIIPVRAIYPSSSNTIPGNTPLGVILFSHGAFSDNDLYDKILNAWVTRGYLALAPQHLDSPQNPLTGKYPQTQQWQLRLEDMQTCFAALANIEQYMESLNTQINPEQLIVTGHSYGAITALALAGAKTLDMESGNVIGKIDLSPRAVIALSPPGLIPKYIEKDAFAELLTPTLVQTGTADVLENFIPDWQLHRAAHDLSPAGDKVLVVGKDVDHYFGGLIGRFEVPGEPQVIAFEDFKALSIDFLDAYGTDTSSAATRLLNAGESGQWSEHIAVEIR